jgi:hypothetical protein
MFFIVGLEMPNGVKDIIQENNIKISFLFKFC